MLMILHDDFINSWVNTCKAGDLRCHRAHYDVIVMILQVPVLYIYIYISDPDLIIT